MRYIFLLITFICFTNAVSVQTFAQTSIDSIHIEVVDLPIQYEFSGSDGHGNDYSSIDTSSYTGLLVRMHPTGESKVLDTLILVGDYYSTLKILYNSKTNQIDSFYYFSLGDWGYGGHASTAIVFTKAQFNKRSGGYDIDLDSAMLTNGNLDYTYHGAGKSGTGNASGSEWRRLIRKFSSTTKIGIKLYGSLPPLEVKQVFETNESLNVYPNPASSILYFRSTHQPQKMKILNLLGREVMTTQMDISNEIDVSSLPPGIYYLRAGNQTQKFVIQR